MKICITASGNSAESGVDPRFGRCGYFVICDTSTGEMEYMENLNASGMGGVGIQAGQMMAAKGVKAVLTGNVGPNAFQTLQAADIAVITGVTGTVGEALERYKTGDMKGADAPSVDSHFGSGKGPVG